MDTSLTKGWSVIAEYDNLIGIQKDAGVLVISHPGSRGHPLVDMVDAVLAPAGATHVHPCHRLDRDTSGVLLFARGKRLQQQTMDIFAQHRVDKRYFALACGTPGVDLLRFSSPIEGKPAKTEARVLARFAGCFAAEVRLFTGRTNQIRIHFAHAGYPLLGDDRFGRRRDFPLRFGRAALHSWSISLVHPTTHKTHCWVAPLAQDLQSLLFQHGCGELVQLNPCSPPPFGTQ